MGIPCISLGRNLPAMTSLLLNMRIIPSWNGELNVPYKQLAVYNIPGALLGIGKYIVGGYLFADNYEMIVLGVQRYTIGSFLVLAVLVSVYWLQRNLWRKKYETD